MATVNYNGLNRKQKKVDIDSISKLRSICLDYRTEFCNKLSVNLFIVITFLNIRQSMFLSSYIKWIHTHDYVEHNKLVIYLSYWKIYIFVSGLKRKCLNEIKKIWSFL